MQEGYSGLSTSGPSPRVQAGWGRAWLTTTLPRGAHPGPETGFGNHLLTGLEEVRSRCLTGPQTLMAHTLTQLSSALAIRTCKASPVPVFPEGFLGEGTPERREAVPGRVPEGVAWAKVQRGWREGCRGWGWGWELDRTQASRVSRVVGFVLRALGSQRPVKAVF